MNLNVLILLVGVLLLTGAAATKLSSDLGIPSLILFLLLGMLVGPDVAGLLSLTNPHIAQTIGFVALVVILFEGGLRTHREELMTALVPSLSLATVGVVITAGIVGISAQFILGIPLELGLLMGAIVGSTDAAAVFSILGQKPVHAPTRRTLEVESGLNDPMAIFLTVLLLNYNLQPEAFSALNTTGFVLQQAGIGLLAGLLFGGLARRSLRRIRLEASGVYPLLLVAGALTAYGLTALAGGSGFLTVYLMGVIITDRDLPFRHSILVFQEGFAWLMQVVLFVMLGVFVEPSQLLTVALPSALLAVVLILVARPVAVLASTLGQGFSWAERAFVSWAGLRGAVPIILATFPLAAGLPNSDLIFDVVFFVVVLSALLQGWSIIPLARALGLLSASRRPRSTTLELQSFGELNADIVEFELPEDSPWVGRSVAELDLPDESLLGAVIREDRFISPRGKTTLEANDVLFVLTEHDRASSIRNRLETGVGSTEFTSGSSQG